MEKRIGGQWTSYNSTYQRYPELYGVHTAISAALHTSDISNSTYQRYQQLYIPAISAAPHTSDEYFKESRRRKSKLEDLVKG